MAKNIKGTKKIKNDLIGAAGVHYVAYRLSLRGLIALPTIRNTAGVDLLVSDPGSGSQAALQIKTSLQRVSFWPTSRHDRCLQGAGAFYVFVRRPKPDAEFEAFLEKADVVVQQVRENAEDLQRRGRKVFAYWKLPNGKAEKLKAAWKTFRPGGNFARPSERFSNAGALGHERTSCA